MEARQAQVPNSARNSGRKPESTPRDENLVPNSSRSARSDVMMSSRSSNPAVTGRSSAGGMETFRTSMDTARVHTALAALSAEKQALLAKLDQIDSALESGEKKRSQQPRFIPTGLKSQQKNTKK